MWNEKVGKILERKNKIRKIPHPEEKLCVCVCVCVPARARVCVCVLEYVNSRGLYVATVSFQVSTVVDCR